MPMMMVSEFCWLSSSHNDDNDDDDDDGADDGEEEFCRLSNFCPSATRPSCQYNPHQAVSDPKLLKYLSKDRKIKLTHFKNQEPFALVQMAFNTSWFTVK